MEKWRRVSSRILRNDQKWAYHCLNEILRQAKSECGSKVDLISEDASKVAVEV